MTRKDCMQRSNWSKAYNRAALVCFFEEDGRKYEAVLPADIIIQLSKNNKGFDLEVMKAINKAKEI